jgi:hypothetical protein
MSSVLGAAVAALAAAALLGSASVAQRHASLTVPAYGPGDPRLVTALIRRPWWWAGTGASVVGLLTALRPTTGTGTVPPGASMVAMAAGGLLIMLAAVAWSRTPVPTGSAAGRVLALAAATGLGYGITAVALKTVGTQLAAGLSVPLQHPALYVALTLGPAAILLSQAALQQGRLATAVVSVILVVDPLVGLLAGLFWFGETVAFGADVAVCAIVLIAGVVLTQRSTRPATPTRPTPAPRHADLARVR